MSDRCSDLSRAAGESLSASATTATEWLLVEVPGGWGRDVSQPDGLAGKARAAADAWLTRTPRSRLLYIRRPGRSGARLAFRVHAAEGSAHVRRFQLADVDELAEADLDDGGEAQDAALVLVCGHGSRDACCALRGTAVFGALEPKLGEDELWISSHHGGHRFAANVLVLPAGLHLGRLEPEGAPYVVARALAGRIELDHYRGRTAYEAPVQAAEHAVRKAAGVDGAGDLRLVSAEDRVVRFRTGDGAEYTAEVEETAGAIVPASCGAEPEPQRAFRARVL